MNDLPISRGALQDIFQDTNTADKRYPFPVFQCLQIKPLSGGPGGANSERYRVVLSDINNYCQSMVATQANTVIKEDRLKKGHLVRLTGYHANSVKGKNVLVVLGLEVLEEYGVREKIGEPVGLEVAANTAAAQPVSVAPRANASMSGSGFYGNQVKKEEPSQSSRMGLPTRAPPPDRHGGNVIYPIEALSPFSHKWTIKARVSHKSDIRRWHKQNSEGRLFSCNLLDESGEIKATAFNEQCDALFDVLNEGQVYYISGCKVSLAKKQFTNLPNDYELAFERDSVVEKAEDSSSVPLININVVPLQSLEKCEKDSTVDVCGVLKEVSDTQEAVAKASGKPYQKREIQLVDDSGYGVRVTLWNKTATSFEAELESILALKGCKVSDFNGRSLSLLASGQMMINPDIQEAHRLKGWWDASGRSETFHSHRDTMGGSLGAATGRSDETLCIYDVKSRDLGNNEEGAPEYFTLKATIVFIRQENFCYPACRGEKCSKKVTSVGDGWRCEACDKTWDNPEYRYIMSVNVNDHTGQMWLSCFDEVGRIIMGTTADEIMALQENGDEQRKANMFEAANCSKLSFRCRAKRDNYGDVPRVRYQVMSATPIDFKLEGHRLADMIKQLSMG